jgi:transcriptional/translational regulatory protein YebC/TACO1
MFDHTCSFKINKLNIDIEELELELIDYGAEELFTVDESILIYASFDCFGEMQKILEELNHEIISSSFDRIPNSFKEVSENQKLEIDKLLEKIENDDDVQNVFHNMK